MKNICFYFQVHIPYILRRYRFFEIGKDHYYYDDFNSENNVRYYADYSFLPANKIIMDLIRETNGGFKCAFSICGTTLEQLEQYAPEVIDSFRELAETGCVEFLAEPYSNSLASIYNDNEFEIQVKAHAQKIQELFGKKPKVFRNSELIYSDEIGEKIAQSIVSYFANPQNCALVERLENAGLQFRRSEEGQQGRTERLAGQSIVISGVFAHHSRDEYKELIEKNGGKNVGSISSKTSFILAGENMGPAKLEKAQKLGIRIVDEEEFLQMIDES